jgi:rod shape-determining protein MreB and related proteins
MFEQALSLWHTNVAIELGSAATRVYVQGRGIIYDGASIVVTEEKKGKEHLVAFGEDAKQLVGRTPAHLKAHFPIQNSVIQNPSLVKILLQSVLETALGGRGLIKPKILLVMPHGLTSNQRQDYIDVLYFVGNRESIYVDSLLCCGLGCKLPVSEPIGNLVLDIGLGSSNIGLLTLSGIATSGHTSIAGKSIDKSISSWLEKNQQISVGLLTAEDIKEALGDADNPDPERTMQLACRDSKSGQAREVLISSIDIFSAIREPLTKITGMLKNSLAKTSPELAADIIDQGLMLCGGTSNLQGIDDFFAKMLNIPTFVIDGPRLAAIRGAGALLEDTKLLEWLGENR